MSGGFSCPACSGYDTRVVDSRTPDGEEYKYRRRLCACGHRFTTYEVTEGLYRVLIAERRVAESVRAFVVSIPAAAPRHDAMRELPSFVDGEQPAEPKGGPG